MSIASLRRRGPGSNDRLVRPLVLRAAALLLLGAASCKQDVRFTGPLHRFVADPAERPSGIATIEDDTRQSPGAPPLVPLLSGPLAVPATSRLRLGSKLPAPLREAKRLLLLPVIRSADGWTTLPSLVVEVNGTADVPSVGFDLPVPIASAGSSVMVNVRALDVSGATSHEHRSPPIRVAADSHLKLATGLLGNPPSGHATFSVEACQGEGCRTIFRREFDAAKADERRWRNATVDLTGFGGAGGGGQRGAVGFARA
jgi:hypothetical protein